MEIIVDNECVKDYFGVQMGGRRRSLGGLTVGEKSKIEWTHHTCNPWSGCVKAHTGCLRCYAETLDRRGLHGTGNGWGEVWAGASRYFAREAYMRAFVALGKRAARHGVRERVFCASRSDFLEIPEAPKSWPRDWTDHQIAAAQHRIWRVGEQMNAQRRLTFDLIRASAAPHWGKAENIRWALDSGRYGGLDWLILTKRPENWRLVPEDIRPLVWFGTSASDQDTAEEWEQRLLEAQGFRYRFISLEPLVGPVDPRPMLRPTSRIDWVIVGGESGAGARECREEWILDIVRQCQAAGVPVFVKQMGRAWAKKHGAKKHKPTGEMEPREVFDAKGGDMRNWPAELRVQRLQEISEENALEEGVTLPGWRHCGEPSCVCVSKGPAVTAFQGLWDSISGERQGRAWADNPWVWAVSFRVVR